MRRPVLLMSLAGLIAFLMFFLVELPANFVLSRFALPIPPAQQIKGSVWSGEMARMTVAGAQLDRVHWQVRPASLLRGALVADLTVITIGGDLAGRVEYSLWSGAVSASDWQGRIDLRKAQVAWRGARFGGQALIRLDSAHWLKDEVLNAAGQVGLQQLDLNSLVSLPAADYQIQLTPEGAGTRLHLRDQGGPVAIDASSQFKQNGTYSLSGTMQPRIALQQEIQAILGMMFEQKDGQYLIQGEGALFPMPPATPAVQPIIQP